MATQTHDYLDPEEVAALTARFREATSAPPEEAHLPRHATRTWTTASPNRRGVVVHHSASRTATLRGLAKYHVGPNHITGHGLPGLSYHQAIDFDGTRYRTAAREAVTASQLAPAPHLGSHPNQDYHAIVLLGDWTSRETAPKVYLPMLLALMDALVPYAVNQIFFHSDFNKPACPGDFAEAAVLQVLHAADADLAEVCEYGTREIQQLLRDTGYGPGPVDGVWGPKTRHAMLHAEEHMGHDHRSAAARRLTLYELLQEREAW